MNVEEIREYCVLKPEVTESFPFSPDALVFKIAGKMFALLHLGEKKFLNLKCDPEKATELREEFEFLIPAYHMNKKHWNTVDLEFDVPDEKLHEWIDHSFELVYAKLPAKVRKEIEGRE